MTTNNPTLERLEDQIAWYDWKSTENQTWFKGFKIVEIITAVAIPLAAVLGAAALLVGSLGVVIVVLEGAQSLNQYQKKWITYQLTSEQLKHEIFRWLAKAGPYASTDTVNILLAERVESLISRKHAKWAAVREPVEEHRNNW